jgi:RNA polymerase sigma-70 factor (ECF subfamily)
MQSDQGRASFATTHWSLVEKAGHQSSAESRRALESLCQSYWYPLYAYVRRRVSDRTEAEDLTQAFFTELIEKNYVGDATPERGRFRAFLLTALKHFLSKQWEKGRAKKRGGGRLPISLDFASADSRFTIEPASNLTAEQIYERQWAVALLDRAIGRLEQEFVKADKGDQFAKLKGFIIGDHEGTTYAEVAGELNMSVAAAKMAASRMRRRYRELIREEIAQTVSEPSEIDDEIQKLFAAL